MAANDILALAAAGNATATGNFVASAPGYRKITKAGWDISVTASGVTISKSGAAPTWPASLENTRELAVEREKIRKE